jgi:hypothetical protein
MAETGWCCACRLTVPGILYDAVFLCSVKKGTEQAAQATVETATNVAGSVRTAVSNVADSAVSAVRSAPDNLAQVGKKETTHPCCVGTICSATVQSCIQ